MLTTKGGFTIGTDPARRLIRITISGFWDMDTVEAYDQDIRSAAAKVMAAAGCARGDLLALVDARQASAQSQELLAQFKDRFHHPDRRPRRIATVVASALLKRQAERIAIPDQRVFETVDEALDWLLKD